MNLNLFETAAGNSPVSDYIDEQDDETQAELLAAIESFMAQFPRVETVDVKHLRGKLWEMRVRDRRGRQHRLLYAVLGESLCLLHAFEKKRQKTFKGDLQLALGRLKKISE